MFCLFQIKVSVHRNYSAVDLVRESQNGCLLSIVCSTIFGAGLLFPKQGKE